MKNCNKDCSLCRKNDPDACKPKDECGVFGIIACENESIRPAYEAYTALYALQHRGQESCGIAVNDGGRVTLHKNVGLVNQVFDDALLRSMPGSMALGHVRYAADGMNNYINASPVTMDLLTETLALAHNGTLLNAETLRREIVNGGGYFQTQADSEIIASLLVGELKKTDTLEKAMSCVMKRLKGAYSIVVMAGDRLIAARDPNGFRPLCLGSLGGAYVFASESCAFDSIGATFLRDIRPGEICTAGKDGVKSSMCGIDAPGGLCVFEYVYTARSDSVIDGISVELARQDMGRALAAAHPVDADIVIGIPDSGLSAALGYAHESGIPYGTGFNRNRYVGRTFIQPTQGLREKSVNLKLNVITSVVAGKRVVMVDDSIVRGTTIAKTVSSLREAGAAEVHMRLASPPYLYPCYFGTFEVTTDMLLAHKYPAEQLRRIIGVDSFEYLPVEIMAEKYKKGYCLGCFTGKYPVETEK